MKSVKWPTVYWNQVQGMFYVWLTVAATTLLICIWATFAGLDRSYQLAKSCAIGSSIPDLSAHILGTKIHLVLMLMLATRLIGLLMRTRFGYVVALIALVAAVVTFRQAWIWSTNTALEFDRQGIFGSRSFPMYGTSPYPAFLLLIFLFVGAAAEVGLLVATTWHYKRRSD
jgi:hypothetical protein